MSLLVRKFGLCLVYVGIIGCQTELHNQACFSSQCFNVEVVYKDADVKRGLMHRKFMDADRGMLFAFYDDRIHSFWMKNTLIPLDIIWLNTHREIVHIETHVPPCQKDPCPVFTPLAPSVFVVELNAGQADRAGLKVGDTAEFRLRSDALQNSKEP